MLGFNDGLKDGCKDGNSLGGLLRIKLGIELGTVDGFWLGELLIDGSMERDNVGESLGVDDGFRVGEVLGDIDGFVVGLVLGFWLEIIDGRSVGK